MGRLSASCSSCCRGVLAAWRHAEGPGPLGFRAPWLPAAGAARCCSRSAGLAEGEGVGEDLGGTDRPDITGGGGHAVK